MPSIVKTDKIRDKPVPRVPFLALPPGAKQTSPAGLNSKSARFWNLSQADAEVLPGNERTVASGEELSYSRRSESDRINGLRPLPTAVPPMSVISADPVSRSRNTPVATRPTPLLGPLKLVGSLWLTVAILFLYVAILLWGTVVANKYGDTAAKFGIYGAWWFNALGFVLGLNSAASLALRWPWKRQQLGFTLPHLGLIVLLVGCFISRYYGVEAVVSVIEGQSSSRAYQSYVQRFELAGGQRFRLQVESSDTGKRKTWIDVPFTSGPFNWQDYTNGNLSTLPWAVEHGDRWVSRLLLGIERLTWGQIWLQGHRDHPGVLYDGGGIRLEVLDYLSSSEPPDRAGDDPRPMPFDKDFADGGQRLRQAKVRLTVDGRSDEFWIPCVTFDPQEMVHVHGFKGEEVSRAERERVSAAISARRRRRRAARRNDFSAAIVRAGLRRPSRQGLAETRSRLARRGKGFGVRQRD